SLLFTFLFLHIPLLPSSPLFPYTTLFRSQPRDGGAKARPLCVSERDRHSRPAGTGLERDTRRVRLHFRELCFSRPQGVVRSSWRSEEHTSELQSRGHLVCRLLLEKKKKIN